MEANISGNTATTVQQYNTHRHHCNETIGACKAQVRGVFVDSDNIWDIWWDSRNEKRQVCCRGRRLSAQLCGEVIVTKMPRN